MNATLHRAVGKWLRERLRLAWPFALALGLVGFSARQLGPVARDNGIRAQELSRMAHEEETLRREIDSAHSESIEERARAARERWLAGEAGVEKWIRFVEEEARRTGFLLDAQVGASSAAGEEMPQAQIIKVELVLKPAPDQSKMAPCSGRLTDLLLNLANDPAWVEFDQMSVRGDGAGATHIAIKLQLWTTAAEASEL